MMREGVCMVGEMRVYLQGVCAPRSWLLVVRIAMPTQASAGVYIVRMWEGAHCEVGQLRGIFEKQQTGHATAVKPMRGIESKWSAMQVKPWLHSC